jgi:hypothetical protein
MPHMQQVTIQLEVKLSGYSEGAWSVFPLLSRQDV